MKAAVSTGAAFARLFYLPSVLEPRLQALGRSLWAYMARSNMRLAWRWLALNWQKVAAWWLTIGLGLTALFLLAALATWQNPEVMLWRVMNWSQGLFMTGGKAAGVLSLIVLVVALPLILPGLVLGGGTLLVLVMGLIVFGPLLLIGLLSFGVLLAFASAKRGGGWLVRFVAESLARSDEKASIAHAVRVALGLENSSRTVQGEARQLQGDELARYLAANEKGQRGAQILLGKVNGLPLTYWTEKHVLLVASSRSGKGRDYLGPNLKHNEHSVFVLDPKGENCMATAAAREAMGNTVAVFDPEGLTGRTTARFNPLANLGAHPVMAADYLAEALIIGEDDHWNESARSLIRALVLHIASAPESQLTGFARDLPTLRALLTGWLDVTLEQMTENPAHDGLVSRMAMSFKDIPPNERGGIVNTARRGTKWLDNPELADLFRAGEGGISFEDLRDESKRLSVFVCLPASVFETHPQVCRLLTSFAMDTMMSRLTGRTRPVLFILDELAQLKHLPIVERAFTLGAGYGLQVWAVFQSVNNAAKLYPLDTLYGSAGVRCFFKLEEPQSCEYASKCASGVLSPADVRGMPSHQALALLDGANPLIIDRLHAPVEG